VQQLGASVNSTRSSWSQTKHLLGVLFELQVQQLGASVKSTRSSWSPGGM
jgi:hypothetical protein